MVVCKSAGRAGKDASGRIGRLGRAGQDAAAWCGPAWRRKIFDEFAEAWCAEHKARPAFKGYRGYPGVGVHLDQSGGGARDSVGSRKLKEGDILSMDFGVELDGYYGDAALTVPVGKIAPEREKLLRVTRESLERAIDKVRPGNRLGRCFRRRAGVGRSRTAIRWCASSWATGSGRRCTRSRKSRTTAAPGHGPRLQEGMVLAIEPMVNSGGPGVQAAGG